MSYVRSASGRQRAARYSLYARPEKPTWRQKRVGSFGAFFAVALMMTFVGFGVAVRSSLLSTYMPALHIGGQTKQPDASGGQAQPVVTKPVSAKPIVDLQQSLQDWGRAHSDQKWSVVVRSLDGPTFQASINADDVHSPAGIYKLYMVLPLFTQMSYDKQQQTVVTVNGVKRPVAKCVDLMIRIADNSCGAAVGGKLDVYKANTQFKQVGMSHTSFSGGNVANLSTTVTDAATLLSQINGSLLDSNSQKLVMDAMRNQIFRSGLPAGCPGCVMADSSGFSAGSVYDVAVVNYSQGKYVIAAFGDGGGFEELAQLGGIVHQRVLDSIR